MAISAPNRPKIHIYVGLDAEGEITNYIILARTKTKEKHLSESSKSSKKNNLFRYPIYFVEKNYNKKSLEGKFQNKIRTAVSGTESNVKTDTEKILKRSFISSLFFQTERRAKNEPAIKTSGEINPKNRHCLRGPGGKFGRWDDILRDILHRNLKIIYNGKATDSDTEEDDDDEDDEEMPDKIGTPKVYDSSERGGRYAVVRTNPEEGALQIHTDGEISGEYLKTNIRRSNRNSKNRKDTAVYQHRKFLGWET